MANENRQPLPKLPYGQGCLMWDSHTEEMIQYKKVVVIAPGVKMRLCVCGYSVEECFSRMAEKVKELKRLYSARNTVSGTYMTMQLGDAIRKYLMEVKRYSIKPRTLDRHEATLDNQICKYDIAKINVSDISEDDLQTHINAIYAKYSYSVVCKTKDLLNMFFGYVYRKDCSENPMQYVIIPGNRIERMAKTKRVLPEDILDDDQIIMLKKHIDNGQHNYAVGPYRFAYLLFFMVETFLRIGEAQALTWDDIDFERRTIKITKTFSVEKNRSGEGKAKNYYIKTLPKTDRSFRTVQLTQDAIWALNKQRELIDYKSSDPIFKTQNGIIAREGNLVKEIKKILNDMGFDRADKFTLHNLRHTGISRCIRCGVSIHLIADMAGHSYRETMDIYYHIIAAERKEFLNIMDSKEGYR